MYLCTTHNCQNYRSRVGWAQGGCLHPCCCKADPRLGKLENTKNVSNQLEIYTCTYPSPKLHPIALYQKAFTLALAFLFHQKTGTEQKRSSTVTAGWDEWHHCAYTTPSHLNSKQAKTTAQVQFLTQISCPPFCFPLGLYIVHSSQSYITM